MENDKLEMRIVDVVKQYMKSAAFTDKKITDIPNDTYSVVNRKYVTLNGTTGTRPTSSVLGQRYFDTTIGRPVYWNGSTWTDGAGSVS